MSAVQLRDLKFFFSTVLLLIFFSCQKKKTTSLNSDPHKEFIEYIALSKVGGEGGYYHIIKITPDSLHLIEGSNNIQKKTVERKILLNADKWQRLNSFFKIKTFKNIKSSPSIQAVDGIDESFQIKTNTNSYIFVNAYADPQYSQFENFKKYLNAMISSNR